MRDERRYTPSGRFGCEEYGESVGAQDQKGARRKPDGR